jgi:hypothetical protein
MTFETLFPCGSQGGTFSHLFSFLNCISHFLIMQELLSLVLFSEEERKERRGNQIIFLCFIIMPKERRGVVRVVDSILPDSLLRIPI